MTARRKTKVRFVPGKFWYTAGSPKGDETGKYLFFAPKRDDLIALGQVLLRDHGFNVARVSAAAKGGSHVLCVYWSDDQRKFELADLMDEWDLEAEQGVAYRYWKSDEDTRAGKYSPQFLLAMGKLANNRRAGEDAERQATRDGQDYADLFLAGDIPF